MHSAFGLLLVAALLFGGVAAATALDGDDDVVAELAAFVEEVRGLDFLHPVRVTILDDAAFAELTLQRLRDDDAETADIEAVLRAIGLLDADDDLAAARAATLVRSRGVYDSDTGEIVVRGRRADDLALQATIVHELTHALDDQHFGLERPEIADSDARAAFSALVEGDAQRVQAAWAATLTDEEMRQLIAGRVDAPTTAVAVSGGTRTFEKLFLFPYQVGPTVLAALHVEGGERRIDEAFARPPSTTEQAIDPRAWLSDGEIPIEIPRPPADGEVFRSGIVGQRLLRALLESEATTLLAAFAASDGWGGDRFVAWREGVRACVRATFAMDTPTDLVELVDALERWAAAQHDAHVDLAGERVTLVSCG